MSAVDLMLFWNDLMHISQTTRVVTASTTQTGYAIDNVRQAELFTAWKPSDSASTDEWLKVDGATTTWLGATAATAYFAIAYDARGSNQDVLRLQYGTTDDGAFAATTDLPTHTLNKTKVSCWYTSFAVPGTAKRWYRLLQKGTDRSGGNVTAKILSLAAFSAADITSMPVDFPSMSEGTYQLDSVHRVSRMRGAGGMVAANKFAASGQRFTSTFKQGKDAFFLKVRDSFDDVAGMGRAIYVQKEGISNAALPSFFMCRLDDDWRSERRIRNQSDLSIPMVTEPWL